MRCVSKARRRARGQHALPILFLLAAEPSACATRVTTAAKLNAGRPVLLRQCRGRDPGPACPVQGLGSVLRGGKQKRGNKTRERQAAGRTCAHVRLQARPHSRAHAAELGGIGDEIRGAICPCPHSVHHLPRAGAQQSYCQPVPVRTRRNSVVERLRARGVQGALPRARAPALRLWPRLV